MARTQLIQNGGFEDGGSGDPWIPTGWINVGLEATEGVQETSEVLSGSVSFKLANPEVAEGIYQTVHLQSGRKYKLSLWIKKIDTVDLRVRVRRGSTVLVNEVLEEGYSSWTEYTDTFTATVAGAYQVMLTKGGGVLAGDFYIDEVSLVAADWTDYDEASTTWGTLDAASTTWAVLEDARDYGGFGHAPRFGHYSLGFGHGLRYLPNAHWKEIDDASTTWGEIDSASTTWGDV